MGAVDVTDAQDQRNRHNAGNRPVAAGIADRGIDVFVFHDFTCFLEISFIQLKR